MKEKKKREWWEEEENEKEGRKELYEIEIKEC